ncbi:cytochrome b [Caulobacter sp. KR2-114]|uniref:cytochrome b n=1 Tax=Caulobacter sp. KR2-114 TaxID=3400912 RepID=UPI003C115C2E
MTATSHPAAPPSGGSTYDARTIALHWLTVLLVGGQWLGAHAIDWFARGGPRTDARSVHILFGVVLAIVIAVRLVWRRSGGQRLPPADGGALQVVANLVHIALYLLVLATVGLGLANAWVRGDSLFGVFSLPGGGDKALRERIGDLHELSANLILLVAGLHSVAALWHQFIRHDGVLGRMVPALARAGGAHGGSH